jgi:maltooligosyltrehalose trehalohydrolase
LLQGETLGLISREGIGVHDNSLELPPMTLAVLMSTSEEVEDRQVAPHNR